MQTEETLIKEEAPEFLTKEVPEILEGLTWDEIKTKYTAQSKLHKIPRPILNRRYKKLQQLIEEDEYFGEDAIKQRQPVLYFLYVERYKREMPAETESVAEMLAHQLMNNEYHKDFEQALKKCGYKKHIDFNESEDITQVALDDNIDELVRIMHDRFLVGLDSKFIDYNAIDNDENLDEVKLIDQDAEEHYFEEGIDEENETMEGESTDTGVLDY